MIKQLLNSEIAKYRDLSVSRRSIICLSLRLRQIIDLLATDKSRYFAQRRPIIVNYVKVIFLSDILSHSYTHICIHGGLHINVFRLGAFVLPELGMDSTLPQFVKKKNILTFRDWHPAWVGRKGKRKERNPAQTQDPNYFKSVIFSFLLTFEACLEVARVIARPKIFKARFRCPTFHEPNLIRMNAGPYYLDRLYWFRRRS